MEKTELGELKTISMGVVQSAGSGTEWIDRLFEEAIRIKKVILNIFGGASGAEQMVKGVLTKHKVDLGATVEDGRIADVAYVGFDTNFTTSGFGLNSAVVVVDFGSDWMEVEEDDLLYLGCYTSLGAGKALALIYYEEI